LPQSLCDSKRRIVLLRRVTVPLPTVPRETLVPGAVADVMRDMQALALSMVSSTETEI